MRRRQFGWYETMCNKEYLIVNVLCQSFGLMFLCMPCSSFNRTWLGRWGWNRIEWTSKRTNVCNIILKWNFVCVKIIVYQTLFVLALGDICFSTCLLQMTVRCSRSAHSIRWHSDQKFPLLSLWLVSLLEQYSYYMFQIFIQMFYLILRV